MLSRLNHKLVLFYTTTVALTTGAIVLKDSAFAYAAAACLFLSLVAELLEIAREKYLGIKPAAFVFPEGERKLITELEARIATLECGVKVRGW